MKKVFRCWQYCKKFLPAPVLNWARVVYSPGYRAGRRAERLRQRVEAAWRQVAPKPPSLVVAGPFRGMRYIEKAVCSELPPKILGTYEMELHALIENIVARQPSCIIDIGAAEGFYAVGFATRLPNGRVVAFESDPCAQELLRQLASLNGVTGRIQVQGHCSPQTLGQCITGLTDNCVVVCDAEGAEFELLDPIQLPALARFPLLVELHPWVHPEIKSLLYSKFTASSKITVVASRPRVVADFSITTNQPSSAQQKLDCMNELRPAGMEWLWIEPKSDHSARSAESSSMDPSVPMAAA